MNQNIPPEEPKKEEKVQKDTCTHFNFVTGRCVLPVVPGTLYCEAHIPQTCKGITKLGHPCSKKVVPGTKYCAIHSAESKPPEARSSRPCQATTKIGNQCSRKAYDGALYCAQHAKMYTGPNAQELPPRQAPGPKINPIPEDIFAEFIRAFSRAGFSAFVGKVPEFTPPPKAPEFAPPPKEKVLDLATALKLFELTPATATHKKIKSIYRQKALVAHPDKGGTADQFKHLTECYEYLMRIYKE